MQKLKEWRKYALALLTLLFAAIFTFALVQVIPSKAVDTVMDQTAEYDISTNFLYTSDGNVSYEYVTSGSNKSKSFTWDPNTYYSAINFSNASELTYSQMTLTVKTAGTIKFQYKSTNAGNNSRYFLHVWKNDDTSAYVVNKSGRQSDYTPVEVEVSDNDVLHFEAALSGAAHWLIQGLKIPEGEFPVEVNVAETDKDNGTVTANGQTSVEGKLTANAEFGTSITLEAKPNEGFFAYWLDETGKVVSCENTFTIDSVLCAWKLTVHFAKIGLNGEKIYYNEYSDEGQYQWDVQDGKYSIKNPQVSVSATRQTYSSVFIEFDVEGATILSFDYNLLRASDETNCYTKKTTSWTSDSSSETIVSRVEGNPAHWTQALLKLDGTTVPATTIKYVMHQPQTQPLTTPNQNTGVPADQYDGSVYTTDIGLGRTGAAGSSSQEKKSFSVSVDQAGTHTLEIRFTTAPYLPLDGEGVDNLTYGVEREDEMPKKDGEAFSFENLHFAKKEAHKFTLKYDENLGEIATEGLGVSEGVPCDGGKTFTLYDDFPITLTATPKTRITSSLDTSKTVNAHFIDWTVGGERSETTTCSLKFEGGKLYFDGKPVDETEISALFQEEVVAPTVWRKINSTTLQSGKPTRVTATRVEINVDFPTAAQKSLFVLFGGYGDGETIDLTVNGQSTTAMSVDKTGELGPVDGVLTDEMKQTFVTNTVNWYMIQQLGHQYEIKITFSKNGYYGTTETVINVIYTNDTTGKIEAKTPEGLPDGANFGGTTKNVFNNLFTEESEAGAYFSSTNSYWSLTSEFDGGETKTAVFEGKYDQSKRSSMNSGGMVPEYWYGSTLAVRNFYRTGTSFSDYQYFNYQGVLTFDIYLEVTKGAGGAKRDAVIIVERRDSRTSGDGPAKLTGVDVVEEEISNRSPKTSDRDKIGLLDHKSNVSIWTGESGGLNSFVTALGDGWYRCVIPTVRESTYPSYEQKDLVQVDGKYVHQTSEFYLTFALKEGVEGRYAIRNVSFRKGTEADFKFSANAADYNGDVKAQAGEELTIDQSTTLGFGSTVTLTATAPNGKKFYGWEVISKDGKSSYLPSTSVEKNTYTLRYTLIDPVEIKAWFGDVDAYSARYGGKFYATLNGAMEVAKESGGDIYLICNTEIKESLTIPNNVRVVIPFDEAGTFMGSASTGYTSQQRIAWASADLVNQYRYLTITVHEDVKIEVFGSLCLGGVVNYADQGYQGHTSGAYSELILKKGSQIVVKNGGVFDVFGRVWGGEGATDMGTITAEKGGKIYEPFLILDFSGGSITLDLFMAQITPFKRYAMINIEVPMTINYGAQLIGHATLYVAQFGEFYSLDQPFISDDTGKDTMIMLKEGGSVTITYDPTKIVGGANLTNCTELIGQTKLVFNGGAKFSYMLFSALGLEVPTAGVYFSIPYNFDVEFNGDGAQYETVTDFMIMPGASVKVGSGATLTLHANAWVYGGFYAPVNAGSKSYPTAAELKQGGYSESGHLIVDGTLIIDKKWAFDEDRKPTAVGAVPATFLGIVETTETTGKIQIAADAILKGTIKDGTDNCKNYFAYATTARVWDAVHKKFGDLEAGQTYTATSGAEFHPENLKYANAEGGEESQTLDLSGVVMHGSWKLVHGSHFYDWSKQEGDVLPTAETKHSKIEHTCMALGCEEKETRELLYAFEDWGHLTYKGEAFTEDDLLSALSALFGEYDLKTAGGSISKSNEILSAGGYDVTVVLTKGFWVTDGSYNAAEGTSSLTKTLTIDKAVLTEENVKIVDTGDETYTGSAITKELSVTFNEKALEGSDYTALQTNNKDAGEATITVTGAGTNFEGTVTLHFQILQRDITDIDDGNVSWDSAEKTYTGEKLQPEVYSVTVDGRSLSLESKAGYTVTYGENVDAGQGTVTIVGQNNYTGSKVLHFKIKKASLTVTLEETEQTYGEAVVTPNITVAGAQNGEESQIKEAIGRTANAEQWSDVGEYDVQWTYNAEEGVLKNYEINFSNKNAKLYKVTAKNIEGLKFEGVESSYTYTGSAIQPTVTVKYGETTLDFGEEQDYTVVYGANTNVSGGGTVTVKAVEGGNYTGSKEISFTITARSMEGAEISKIEDVFYNGQDQKLKPESVTVSFEETVLTLQEGDYEVSWSAECKNVGEVTVTLTGKGNFESTATTTYHIKQKDITGATVTVTGSYTYNGSAQTPAVGEITVTVEGVTGDVTVTVKKAENNTNASDMGATVTVEGNGNFTGTATGKFSIAKKAITITVNDIEGTYGDVAPVPEAFTVPEGALAGNDQKEVLHVTLTLAQSTNGKYLVGTEYAITGTAEADNYTVSVTSGKYTVSAKALTVEVRKQAWATYSAQEQSAQKRFGTDWALAEGSSFAYQETSDVLGIELSATGKDAGSYDITATWNNNQNYTVTFKGADGLELTDGNVVKNAFVIAKKEITVTAKDITVPDDTEESVIRGQLGFEIEGLIEGDENDVESNIEVTLESVTDGARITVKFKASYTPANYFVGEEGFVAGTLHLTDSIFRDVVFESDSVVYDGKVHEIEASKLPEGAKATYRYEAQSGSTLTAENKAKDVGTYSVTVEIALEGYKGYNKTVTLTITRKSITIRADSVEKIYGDALVEDADLTFTVPENELAEGDEKDVLTVELHWQHTATVGQYDITGTATAKNYTVTVESAKYVISPKPIDVTVKTQNWATYSGNAQSVHTAVDDWDVAEGALVGSDNKTGLNVTLKGSGTDAGSYNITAAWNNQNYTVTFKGEGGLTVKENVVEKAFVIAPKELNAAAVTVSGKYVYSGSAITPEEGEVTVTLEGFGTLTVQKDYTFSAKDNVDASEKAVLTIEGTGNYCGTATKQFTIAPKDIAEAVIAVEAPESIVYNGLQQKPNYTISLAGYETVTVGEPEYGANLTVAEGGSITLHGTGNFSGTATVKFAIAKKALSVTLGTASQVYGETSHTAFSVTASVGEEDSALMEKEGEDIRKAFTLAAEGVTQWSPKGSYALKATYDDKTGVLANYDVTLTNNGEKLYTVTAKSISSGVSATAQTATYNGKAQEASLTVVFAGYLEHFTKGTDYTVSYDKEAVKDADTYTVTITGQGNYEGSFTCKFVISKAAIDSFTVEEQDLVYSGEEQALTLVVKAGELTLQEEEYDLTVNGSLTDAGTATLTVKGKGNFSGEKTLAVTISAAPLTQVTVEGSYTYDGTEKTPSLSVSAGTLKPDAGEYSVSYQGNLTNAGQVTVKVTGSGNYKGTVEAVFTIEKAEIAVTLEDKTSVYGDAFQALTFTYEGVIEKDASSVRPGDYLTLTTEATEKKDVGEYAITATAKQELANYTIAIAKEGNYKVTERPVSVHIYDQSATYDYEAAKTHAYPFDGTQWALIAESGSLAPDETSEMLGIVLTVGELGGAGEYVITGSHTNTNYAVTFVGSYEKEGDELSGHAGVYTVKKHDISGEAIFILLLNGEGGEAEGLHTVRAKFGGEALVLSGSATLFVGLEHFELPVSIDPQTLEDIGEYTVTLTVEHENYCGAAVYTVIITDADGYTQRLKDVLAALEELVKDLDIENLKADDYAVLVDVYAALNTLDDAEREVGAERLAEYEDYVAAWEALADLDDKIETAQTIADAPIEALFEAAAALAALAGIAYIVMKGGIL